MTALGHLPIAAGLHGRDIPQLRARVPHLTGSFGAMFDLFIAGRTVALPVALDELEPHVDYVAAGVRARCSILPLEPGRRSTAFIACDRLDAHGIETVCWPDDSSYHLAKAIPPGRRATWLDLGGGSAVAQLLRPQLADVLVASDLNPRAASYARLGAELSGIRHLQTLTGDLEAVEAELITCNAPIPGDTGPLWSATDERFMTRLFGVADRALADGGMVVAHAALDAIPSALGGEVIVVAYTPPGTPREFAVVWWRPDGEARQIRARRPLDLVRPHLDHMDREAALAGTLSPL
ncbi:MAG: hypothetical protein ABI678_10545 [Kofleriaceae bacterium]